MKSALLKITNITIALTILYLIHITLFSYYHTLKVMIPKKKLFIFAVSQFLGLTTAFSQLILYFILYYNRFKTIEQFKITKNEWPWVENW